MIQATLRDNQNGGEIEVGEMLMIGRREGCQLQIRETKVSRQHAMIRRQGGGYWLYDLASSNGSYLNGHRVIDGEKLRDGDVIRIGGSNFTFCSEGIGRSTIGLEQYSMEQTRLDIQTVPVLMLVADIKGFSDISEKMPTEVLAQAMSSWYRECKVVLEHCRKTIFDFQRVLAMVDDIRMDVQQFF